MIKRTVSVALLAFFLTMTGCTCTLRRPVPTAGPTALPQSTGSPSIPTSIPSMPGTFPTTSPAPPTIGVPDVGYLGSKQQGGTLGDLWTLRDVRVGLHDDRLRVVVEMKENRSHAPYYEASEVENEIVPFPTGHDPSWGMARIDLIVSDLYLLDFPVSERLPLSAPDNPVVTRIGLYPIQSDAHIGFSIGLEEPAIFDTYYLTEPVRIVVDVLYP